MLSRRTMLSNLFIAIIIIQFLTVISFLPDDAVEGALYGEMGDWTLIGRDEYFNIEGGGQDQRFGESIAAGDMDGDGRDDIAIGIPDHTANGKTGSVLVFFARDLDEIFPLKGTQDADLIIFGEDPEDKFGANLAFGDLNGDGRDELLISATRADGKGNIKRNSGEVYILAGRERSEFKSTMHIGNIPLFGHIYGRDGGDQIGIRMVIGDLDGDGIDDLALGTNGAGGHGGTDEFHTDSENNVPGSWEIEIIKGQTSPLNDIYLGQDPITVRYLSSYNASGVFPGLGANHAMGIGTGMEILDLDGDGYNDLTFSFTRWVFDTPMRSDVCVINGAPSFPYVMDNSSVDVIINSFSPNLTINLNDTVLSPPSLAGGNLDGDGFDDLVIGGYNAMDFTETRFDAGRVWILRGFDHSGEDIIYSDRFQTTIFGEDSSDLFGKELLCVDIDGDSHDELLVGAPEADGLRNLYNSCGEGYRFEFDGVLPHSLNATDAEKRYMGMWEGQRAFSRIVSLSINRDDNMEFLVLSPGYPGDDMITKVGLASVFMERQEFVSRFFGGDESDLFGHLILTADFDNDGYQDIVVSDPSAFWTGEGGAYLFFGSSKGFGPVYEVGKDVDIEYALDFLPSQASFGSSISSGDLNNDGYPDLIIGAPDRYDGAENPGSVSIFWGGNRSYMEEKNGIEIYGSTVETTGYAVSAGDFNGDGIDDLAVSSPDTLGFQSLNRYHAGAINIILGPITSATGRIQAMADSIIYGSIPREHIGMGLITGDIDGDSIDDIIIGAPRSSLGSVVDQGLVYIVKGRSSWPASIDLASDPSIRIFGAWPYDQAGKVIATGDVDGDSMDDLAIGCPNGDGFQRRTDKGGNVFLLLGKYISSLGNSGNISLRYDSNITIFGEEALERLGSSVAFGDLSGDGLDDIVIGAKGWKDQFSGSSPGAVMILQSTAIGDGSMLNSSTLPVISSKGDGDFAGSSVAISNISGDQRMDILIGAPYHDPLDDGSRPGGVFLWEGKDLNYRDLKVSIARLSSDLFVNDPFGIKGDILHLSPKERSYHMKLNARSLGGYQNIDSISVTMLSASGDGEHTFTFHTDPLSIDQTSTGSFSGNIWLDIEESSWRNDGAEKWYLDIAFGVGWDLPEIDQIITRVDSGTEYHENYLSDIFQIDRTISIDGESVEISTFGPGIRGWIKNDSIIEISNISLIHGINGERFGEDTLQNISLGLFRSDGLMIGKTQLDGAVLRINSSMPGDGIDSSNARFSLAPISSDPLPTGSQWNGDHVFSLKVDTIPPPAVSSFNVFPDGREKGITGNDDDRFLEIRWENILDLGPSGIRGFVLWILNNETGEIEMMDTIKSGDLIMVNEGTYILGLHAVDNAGNNGSIIWRSVNIDLTPPRFSGEFPESDSWLTGDDEILSIMVSDNETGLDRGSAFYRIYRSDSRVLSHWMPVLGWESSDNGVRLVADVPNVEGFGHYVQWKVQDNVGTEAVSEPFGFNIDLTPPSIERENDIILGEGEHLFETYMEDQQSWLDLSTLEFRISSVETFQEAEWYNPGLTGFRVSYSPLIEVKADFHGFGFAQWRVKDRAGNSAESDPVSVLVDRELPQFSGFIPNTSIVQNKEKVEITAFIREPLSGMTDGDVEISVSRISDWVRYGVGGYSPWTPVNELTEVGDSYQAIHTVKLEEGPFNLVRFRARDSAGNGWVISRPLSIEVDLMDVNLPPTSLFIMKPVSDMVFKGETFLLDGSPSIDPEGENLTYRWYSDLEGFPASGLLGKDEKINVSLRSIGVHNIWLTVTDGVNTVESERVRLRVVDRETEDTVDEENGENMISLLKDSLLFILIALVVGVIIGAIIVYLLVTYRKEERPVGEGQILVDAEYQTDFIQSYCPYCAEKVNPQDEYCFKCGTLFTEKDKRDMLKGKKPSKKRMKKRDALKSKHEEEDNNGLVIDDWDMDEDVQNDFFADEPEEEEDFPDLEDLNDETLEEVEEIEMDLEEMDLEGDDDDIWEVEE